MTRALLPTPLPPASFAQLNAARARSAQVAHMATKTAAANRSRLLHLRAKAAQAPLPGYAGVNAAPTPIKHTPAPSWLWFPAIVIAGLFLYTFFSKKTAEKSKARREAGARFVRRIVGTPANVEAAHDQRHQPSDEVHEVDSTKTEQ